MIGAPLILLTFAFFLLNIEKNRAQIFAKGHFHRIKSLTNPTKTGSNLQQNGIK